MSPSAQGSSAVFGGPLAPSDCPLPMTLTKSVTVVDGTPTWTTIDALGAMIRLQQQGRRTHRPQPHPSQGPQAGNASNATQPPTAAAALGPPSSGIASGQGRVERNYFAISEGEGGAMVEVEATRTSASTLSATSNTRPPTRDRPDGTPHHVRGRRRGQRSPRRLGVGIARRSPPPYSLFSARAEPWAPSTRNRRSEGCAASHVLPRRAPTAALVPARQRTPQPRPVS